MHRARYLATQEILRNLWSSMVHYRVHKRTDRLLLAQRRHELVTADLQSGNIPHYPFVSRRSGTQNRSGHRGERRAGPRHEDTPDRLIIWSSLKTYVLGTFSV